MSLERGNEAAKFGSCCAHQGHDGHVAPETLNPNIVYTPAMNERVLTSSVGTRAGVNLKLNPGPNPSNAFGTSGLPQFSSKAWRPVRSSGTGHVQHYLLLDSDRSGSCSARMLWASTFARFRTDQGNASTGYRGQHYLPVYKQLLRYFTHRNGSQAARVRCGREGPYLLWATETSFLVTS